MRSLSLCWRGGLVAAALFLATAAGLAAPCPNCPPETGSDAIGYFVPIGPEHMVENRGGNCGFCAIETIARYQGLTHMHGFSRGKGGSSASSMASWLQRYGVQFEQTTSRRDGIELMKRFLANGQPVLFSIPRHALVCCGWSRSADGREFIWVVDNTGSEGCEIRGWPKSEWDRRFGGWVCGLLPLFDRPRPNTPGRHPEPAPGLVPPATPTVVDRLAEYEKKLAGLLDLEKRLALVEKTVSAESAAVQETQSRLERVKELVERTSSLAATVSTKFSEEVPKLHAAVNQAKDLGLVSSEKADKAHAALDKVGAVAGVITEVREKVAASQAEARTSGVVGWLGGGAGLLGMILGLVATLRKPEGPKILPSQIPQLPGNPILNAAANLPQIPGTIADDVARVVAQRIQAIFGPPGSPPPSTTPAAPAA